MNSFQEGSREPSLMHIQCQALESPMYCIISLTKEKLCNKAGEGLVLTECGQTVIDSVAFFPLCALCTIITLGRTSCFNILYNGLSFD